MSKINQFLLDRSNHSEHVFIFKIRLSSRFVYMVGSCETDPLIKLQEVLLKLHDELDYLCQAKVLVSNKSTSHKAVSLSIQSDDVLYLNLFYFSDSFSVYTDLFDIDEAKLLHLYHKYIPDVVGLTLESKLPSWALSDEEIELNSKMATDENEDYYLVFK